MANTDVNYLNPGAFQPKIGWQPVGARAGQLFNNGVQDYENILGQQMRMQDLGEQERRLGLEQKIKDVPLQDATRAVGLETQRGLLPGARGAAEAGQGATTAQANLQRKTFEHSASFDSAISDLKAKMNENEWKQFARSNQIVGSLVNQAMELGPLEGPKFLQSQREQLRKSGVDVPDYIDNPANWEKIRAASVYTIEQIQKLDTVRAQGDQDVRGRGVTGIHAENVARITAQGHVDAASNRSDRNPPADTQAQLRQIEARLRQAWSNPQERNRIIKQEYIPVLSEHFDETPMGKRAAEMAGMNPTFARRYEDLRTAFLTGRLQQLGLIERDLTPAEKQEQQRLRTQRSGGESAEPGKGRPALGSFD